MILILINEYDLKIFSMYFTKVIVMMMMKNKMMAMVMVTIIVMTKMILSSQVANLKGVLGTMIIIITKIIMMFRHDMWQYLGGSWRSFASQP